MEPQLVLLRIATQSQSSSTSLNLSSHSQRVEGKHFRGVAKWDLNHPYHLAMSERKGILQTYTLETTAEGSKPYLYPCGSFQLHLDFEPSDPYQEPDALHNIKINHSNSNNDGIASLCFGPSWKRRERKARTNLIEQAWGSFEFIPGRSREIIFFQDGSTRVLFTRLPGGSPTSPKFGETSMARIDSGKSKVYCVGRHSSTILSIAVRGDGVALVSAARDGYIRIWRISDGSMLAQTMFSRWRQPRSPRYGKGSKSPFSRYSSEVEMDKMSSSMQVLSFLNNSSDLYMGCPNGEVRIWSLTECESNHLTISEVGSSTVGKDVISSLALHVPNCNFPVQCNAGANRSCSFSPQADTEFLAIGTINQNLRVWTKKTTANEWLPLWSTTLPMEGAGIGSLSFRADGGLLAVSASRFGKYTACNDPLNNSSESSLRIQNQFCDRLYIYNTSSWDCEGWLSFTSHLGSCLFYCPHFTEEDKNEPRSSASQLKVLSCRLLLVSTSSGPQTHILPEYGLFGSIHDQPEQHKLTQLDCRKEAKNMHEGSSKRGVLPQCFNKKETQDFPEVEGEGDGSGTCCTSSPMPMKLQIEREAGDIFSVQDFFTDEKSPKLIQGGPVRELLDEQTGLQSLRQVVSQDHKSQHQSNPRIIKTKRHPRKSSFKQKTSNLRDLEESLLPRDHAIKKHKCKKQLPVSFVNQTCQLCKKKSPRLGFEEHKDTAASSNSLLSLNPSPSSLRPHKGQETEAENSSMEANIAKVEKSHLRTVTDTTTVNEQNVGTQTTQAFPCQNEDKILNPKVKKEVTFTKTPEVIPCRNVCKTASSGATNSHSRKQGGKGRLGGVSRTKRKSWDSKKENQKTLGQDKLSNQQRTGNEQGCDPINFTQFRQRTVGGDVLRELLVMNEEDSPFKDRVQMGATFRAPNPLPKSLLVKPTVDSSKILEENKQGAGLHRPIAFSTASLMQKLQEIEDEKFDLEAAIQVAKAKGIALSKHDKEQIKAALEEERKTGSSKYQPGLVGRKPSARYIPLLKIPDPRTSYSGPFVAPRKVRKQCDAKGEDVHIIQPALFDLWDEHERCPQVSSANLGQANTFSVTSWRRALGNLCDTNKNSVWVQREDVCRGAACAQNIYDNCLYGQNLELQCHCYQDQGNLK